MGLHLAGLSAQSEVRAAVMRRWRERLDARVAALPRWLKMDGAVGFAFAVLIALAVLIVRAASARELLPASITNVSLFVFVVFCALATYGALGLLVPGRVPLTAAAVFVVRRVGWSMAAVCVYALVFYRGPMVPVALPVLVPALGAAVLAAPNR